MGKSWGCGYCKQVTGSLLNRKEICKKCINEHFNDGFFNTVPNDLFIGFAITVLIDNDFPERFRDGKNVEDIFIDTVGKKSAVPENKEATLIELEKVVKKLYEINM